MVNFELQLVFLICLWYFPVYREIRDSWERIRLFLLVLYLSVKKKAMRRSEVLIMVYEGVQSGGQSVQLSRIPASEIQRLSCAKAGT
jgi:hypothetical protein